MNAGTAEAGLWLRQGQGQRGRGKRRGAGTGAQVLRRKDKDRQSKRTGGTEQGDRGMRQKDGETRVGAQGQGRGSKEGAGAGTQVSER